MGQIDKIDWIEELWNNTDSYSYTHFRSIISEHLEPQKKADGCEHEAMIPPRKWKWICCKCHEDIEYNHTDDMWVFPKLKIEKIREEILKLHTENRISSSALIEIGLLIDSLEPQQEDKKIDTISMYEPWEFRYTTEEMVIIIKKINEIILYLNNQSNG